MALLVAGGAVGCLNRPLLPFSLETPPIILAPASFANVADGRGRFREVYCAIRAHHGQTLPEDVPCEDAIVRLADEPDGTRRVVSLDGPTGRLRVAVVPGIFGECIIRLVSPFSDALAHLESHGYRTGVIRVSGTSSSAHNARQIRDAVLSMEFLPGERLLLIGYSKGAADVLEALIAFPEILPRVAAMVSVAGVIAGSPLADGTPDAYLRLLRWLDVTACDPGDGRGVESLRRSVRLRALSRAPLPPSVKYFSVAGIVERSRTSALLRGVHRRLSEVDPRNDGQVIFSDAIIPGGVLLGFVRADHWAIAVPFSRSVPSLAATVIEHNAFPREVLLEALVRIVEESL